MSVDRLQGTGEAAEYLGVGGFRGNPDGLRGGRGGHGLAQVGGVADAVFEAEPADLLGVTLRKSAGLPSSQQLYRAAQGEVEDLAERGADEVRIDCIRQIVRSSR
jgi:hypothetical protein